MSSVGPRSCPLRRVEDTEDNLSKAIFKCNGCKMPGIGPIYETAKPGLLNWTRRDRVLHPQCATPRQFICPAIMSDHVFAFKKSPVKTAGQRYCDACGMKILGYNYHESDLGYDLHPSCASLPAVIATDHVKLIIDREVKLRNCLGCKSDSVKGRKEKDCILGFCYVLETDPHRGYHVFCAMNMALAQLDNGAEEKSLSKKRSSAIGSSSSSSKTELGYKILKFLVDHVIAVLSGNGWPIAKVVAEDVLLIAKHVNNRFIHTTMIEYRARGGE